MKDNISSSRVCVIILTYNNGKTIASVIKGVRRLIGDVIVVNDGSNDETGEILAQLSGIELVRHMENQGKGAALRHGFQKALELGYDHAITIDADAQHLPEDIPRFIEAMGKDPEALWVGARNLGAAGAPKKNRFANRLSNFWLWAETGRWLSDTQCGLRCYPLHSIADLKLVTTGYEFEVEVLVKAAWTGIALKSVPVNVVYFEGAECVSHFRPVKDFLLISHLNARLVALRLLLPVIIRKMLYSRRLAGISLWRKLKLLSNDLLLEGATSPFQIAASVGLGMCMGILPIWGYQMAAAALVAHRVRLNKFIAVAASNISFPVTIPIILYASLLTGRWVISGQLDYSLGLSDVTGTVVWNMLAEYMVGSIILALTVGLAGGALTYMIARLSWLIRAGVRRRGA